jgi:MFS family permease
MSGFAAKKYGEKRILMVSLLALIIGQLCFVTAMHARLPSLMIFGRVMIGMGGEIPGVIASDIVTRWFQ